MKIKILLANLVALTFLYLFLRKVDFAELGAALAMVSPLAIGAAVAINMVSFWIRTVRWRRLLSPLGSFPFSRLFKLVVIGFCANNLVPRSGELARPLLLGRSEKQVSASAAFATVVIERVFDFLVVLLLFGAISLLAPVPTASDGLVTTANLRRGGLILAACSISGLGLLVALRLRARAVVALARAVCAPLPQRARDAVLRLLGTFVEGLSVLGRPGDVFWGLFQSTMMWIAIICAAHAVLLGAGLSALPWWSSTFLVGASALAMIIPSPGGVGTVHMVVSEVLERFGSPVATAKSAAIVIHASSFVPILLLGLYFLHTEHLRIRDLGSANEQNRAEELIARGEGEVL
ncbi:MAG: flippase-like domain-containing protein [Candidatus Schekmanbacteria bacterium]|nr:flippase-like domain-containing protein [Candidatus Schekmanbacteria bacterium]